MKSTKFRMYDLKDKLFAEPKILKDDYNLNEIFLDERYVFQQFTGLKDKNGKEIYEGDIMSSEMGNGRITWVECSGKFVLEGDNFLINPWDGYEVIGNIFENHNLLTK